MEQTAIKVSSVGIKFFLNYEDDSYVKRFDGLHSLLFRRKKKEFWALKDINFETKKGEIFGIIGSNGAGKSTLLKIIAGIFPATEGEVRVNGNIAPLIELGAAFNPELTGIENIFLTGSIYKIPRKVIRENIDKIIEFSGLRKFVDIPIKNYSSGMFIRLAFSIVIFFRPEIVLIDEVFAVGDETFQQKSFEKILSFRKSGASIILVSHDVNIIKRICDRVLILSHGKASFIGPPEEAINHYHNLIKGGEGIDEETMPPAQIQLPVDARRWGTKEFEITSVRFFDKQGNSKNIFYTGDYFEAQISYDSHLKEGTPVFGVGISTIYKLLIFGPNTLDVDFQGELPGKGKVKFIIPSLPLFEGDYLFSASAYDSTLKTAYDHHEMMYHFRVLSRGIKDFGCVRMDSHWEIESE